MNKQLVTSLLLGLGSASKCPYGFQSDSTTLAQTEDDAAAKILYPSQIFQCTKGGVLVTDVDNFHVKNYQDIVKDVIAEYDLIDKEHSANKNPRGDFAGCIVRMAGHDFMDFRVEDEKFQGGADGCVSFADGDNAGLQKCLAKANMPQVFQKHCDKVSLADFLVIIAEAVMGRTASDFTDNASLFAEDKLATTFRDNFRVGRKTAETCSWDVGRMPNPEHGCSDLRDVFVDNIFFGRRNGWALTMALSGVHSLGKASPENSGYDGFWSDAKSQGHFNNDYYRSLLYKGWGPELAVGNNKAKNQWKRIDKGFNNEHKEMMLNSDLCLIYDNNRNYAFCSQTKKKVRRANRRKQPALYNEFFKQGQRNCNKWINTGDFLLATEGNCCGWINRRQLDRKGAFKEGHKDEFCGAGQRGLNRERTTCCKKQAKDSYGDCDMPQRPGGPAFRQAAAFAGNEKLWIDYFTMAWKIATHNGYEGSLLYLDQIKREKEAKNKNWEQDEDVEGCAEYTGRRECRKHIECQWGKFKVTPQTKALAQGGEGLESTLLEDEEDDAMAQEEEEYALAQEGEEFDLAETEAEADRRSRKSRRSKLRSRQSWRRGCGTKKQ